MQTLFKLRFANVYRSAPWAMIAAFGTYFCMYGFRKPFTAVTYEGISLWGIGFKTILITSQTIGYALSKVIGIKVISEIKAGKRALGILLLIGFAELMLLGFSVVPAPYNFIFLFFNGLPLGMVFGLVLGYLEGRRVSEALIAGLCASFILADGFTKSLGKGLLQSGITTQAMPVLAGALFIMPLLLFVWMLTKIPPPTKGDIAHRSARNPMSRNERNRYFAKYGIALAGILIAYLFCTLLRSLRSDFAPEIWDSLGYANIPGVFTQSEIVVTIIILVLTGLMMLIKDSRRALSFSLLCSVAGFILVAISAGLLQKTIDGFYFMIILGVGTYLPYVAVHTTVFERFLSLTRENANIGFLMYIADTVGYIGYIGIMFVKDTLKTNQNFFTFFTGLSVVISLLSIVALIFSLFSINHRFSAKT
jgi:hypothetical protein